jgi:hypothetical protein
VPNATHARAKRVAQHLKGHHAALRVLVDNREVKVVEKGAALCRALRGALLLLPGSHGVQRIEVLVVVCVAQEDVCAAHERCTIAPGRKSVRVRGLCEPRRGHHAVAL